MFGTVSDIVVIAGHYGSGKTEFAVNLAFHQAKYYENVMLLDLDIVNPYFCSREQEQNLTEAGIEFIAPSPQCRVADVPALPAEINKIFEEYAPKFNVPVYRGLPFGHHSQHLAIDFARTATVKDGVITFPAVSK